MADMIISFTHESARKIASAPQGKQGAKCGRMEEAAGEFRTELSWPVEGPRAWIQDWRIVRPTLWDRRFQRNKIC